MPCGPPVRRQPRVAALQRDSIGPEIPVIANQAEEIATHFCSTHIPETGDLLKKLA